MESKNVEIVKKEDRYIYVHTATTAKHLVIIPGADQIEDGIDNGLDKYLVMANILVENDPTIGVIVVGYKFDYECESPIHSLGTCLKDNLEDCLQKPLCEISMDVMVHSFGFVALWSLIDAKHDVRMNKVSVVELFFPFAYTRTTTVPELERKLFMYDKTPQTMTEMTQHMVNSSKMVVFYRFNEEKNLVMLPMDDPKLELSENNGTHGLGLKGVQMWFEKGDDNSPWMKSQLDCFNQVCGVIENMEE